jgi:uncharacterized protein (TIGR02996 family)
MTAAAALQARTRGEIDAALALALDAWRRTRAPVVADALDALDREARAAFSAPRGRTSDEFHAGWMKLATAEPTCSGVGWLAATFTRMLPGDPYLGEKQPALMERVRALQPYLPDPRVARAFVDVVVAAPFHHGVVPEAQVYGPLLDAIAATRDLRCVEPLERVRRMPRAKTIGVRDYLAGALPRVIAALRAVQVSGGDDERAAWRALLPGSAVTAAPRARTQEDGPALLRRIRQDPRDDGARLVYADWLLERGDPHGELIVLQQRLTAGQASAQEQARARALLRDHRDALLGPLALVLCNVVFERGFLARAELAQNAAAAAATWAQATGDERLATLVELRKGRGNSAHFRAFLTSPWTRGLEAMDVPLPSMLDALLDGDPRPARQLSFGRRANRKLLQRLAESTALARVDALRFFVPGPEHAPLLDDLAASGMLDRLRELTFSRGYIDGAPIELLARWPSMPASIEKLVLEQHGSECALERRDGQGVATIRRHAVEHGADAIIAALPREIVEVRIEPGGYPLRPDARSRIEAAVAKRPELKVVF